MGDAHHDHDPEDEKRHEQEVRCRLAAQIVALLPLDRRQAFDVIERVIAILELPRPPIDAPPEAA
jgi:hypothetical protein